MHFRPLDKKTKEMIKKLQTLREGANKFLI